MRGRRMAACVGAIVLLAGACGDDDDDTVNASTFVAEVNAVCEERDAKIAEIFEDFPEEPSGADMQRVVGEFVPILRDYRDEVRAAGVPDGREDDYRAYLDLLDEALQNFEGAEDDPDEAREVFEEDDPRFAELERKLGLDDCADSSQGGG